MRNRVRIGFLASGLLLVPLGAMASASAVPLEAAPAQADQVAVVCTMQYPASLFCQLASLSAGAGSAGK